MSEQKETTKPEVAEEVKSEGGDMKIKSKPKMKKFNATKEEPVKVDLTKDPNVKTEEPVKVDLTKKTEDDAIQIGETKEVSVEEPSGNSDEMGKSVQESGEAAEGISPLKEVTEEEVKKEEIKQPELQPIKKVVLPDNVEKLVQFMEDTGGDIQDYVRLNADYSNVNEDVLLKEYYKNTKPLLTDEEISFVMEDQFRYDTDTDEERDIRKRKLAKKEAVAEARNHLESLKQKYYDEIKLRPGVTQEQQKAMEFFNRYNNEQEIAEQKHKKFIDNTKQFFTDDFKGFDFEVGEKKFRYGVKDPNAIAENQSNLNNFVEKFLDKEGNVKDTRGYHKAMYAAQNIDRIVNHFYEQGKSDGIKNVVEGSKNPTTETRQTSGDIFIGGLKVKAIDGVDSSKLRIKRSKFNN